MKRIPILALLAALGGFLGACSSTSMRQNPTSPDRPVRLQVTVNLPPSMSILHDDFAAEAFAYRVSASLHEQGLRGRIHYVEMGDAPAANIPVLEVMLREWRVDRMGNVDCTFTANLKTPAGTKSLGIFSGTSMMMWSRRDWSARDEGFEDSARDALGHLGARIMSTGLLPDVQFQ